MRLSFFTALFALLWLASCQHDPKPAATGNSKPVQTLLDSTGAPVRGANPWADAGCNLLTQEEIVRYFSIDVHRDAYNEHSAAGQGYCLRYWNKPDWASRDNATLKGAQAVSPRNSIATQIFNYGTAEMARQQYEFNIKNRGDVYEEQVPGLGDGALWSSSTTTLLVWKGHLCLQLTLDWADQPHDNLEKARELAAMALKKM
ncbi:MAG TPA: hypothetical protein PKL15_00055 [Saprospiraceae bacterium]|nr:hypothetical protein [Saprospiraceae bacterium]